LSRRQFLRLALPLLVLPTKGKLHGLREMIAAPGKPGCLAICALANDLPSLVMHQMAY
jgi:hypothetical protein